MKKLAIVVLSLSLVVLVFATTCVFIAKPPLGMALTLLWSLTGIWWAAEQLCE